MSDLLCLLCTSLSKRKRGLQCSLVDVVLGLALARQPQVSSWAVTFSLLQLGPALGGDLILVFVNIYIHIWIKQVVILLFITSSFKQPEAALFR